MNTKGDFRLIVAGGGTGGHFFPGLAVAQAVRHLVPSAEVLFVGSLRGIEARLAPHYGFPFRGLRLSGFAGLSPGQRVRALSSASYALFTCLRIQGTEKPSVVLGVGGYASVPMVAAASLSGVPVVLLEQNALPGLANRLLSRMASLVVIAFPQTARHFRGKARLLGNPARSSLASVGPEGEPERPFRLLVFGGSRGAKALNEVLMAALPALKVFPGGVEILHQTGQEDLARVRKAYKKAGLPARVEAFLFDMEKAYAWCHGVVCRAGATSLAELAVAGRPALLVPYPHAASGHQLANARGMEELGGALCLEQKELTPETLLANLRRLADRDLRRSMVRALKRFAKPEAAERIASLLLTAGDEP